MLFKKIQYVKKHSRTQNVRFEVKKTQKANNFNSFCEFYLLLADDKRGRYYNSLDLDIEFNLCRMLWLEQSKRSIVCSILYAI